MLDDSQLRFFVTMDRAAPHTFHFDRAAGGPVESLVRSFRGGNSLYVVAENGLESARFGDARRTVHDESWFTDYGPARFIIRRVIASFAKGPVRPPHFQD
jgi:hypothetical protein